MEITLGFSSPTPQGGMRERVRKYSTADFGELGVGACKLKRMVTFFDPSGQYIMPDVDGDNHLKLLMSIGVFRFGSKAFRFERTYGGRIEVIGDSAQIEPDESKRRAELQSFLELETGTIVRYILTRHENPELKSSHFPALTSAMRFTRFLASQIVVYEVGSVSMAALLAFENYPENVQKDIEARVMAAFYENDPLFYMGLRR